MEVLTTRAQARACGSKFYFTGRPCPKGHVSQRFASTATCFMCVQVWNAQHKSRVRELKRAYAKNWRKTNPGKNAANVQQWRADLTNRIPAWLTESDKAQIEQLYRNCPVGHHVDHIIPLRGKLVSGLHVPNNLQWLPAHENIVKGNSYAY